jgi:hypothetical protein
VKRCERHSANRFGGRTLATPLGEAMRICSTNVNFSQIFLCFLRFVYLRVRIAEEIVFADFFLCFLRFVYLRVRIAEEIVLAQHKENKRIGKARKSIRSASPIVIEIA